MTARFRPDRIVDTRVSRGVRGPGAHSIHPDADPDAGVFSAEVADWIQDQLEHMISPRGNDAENAAGDLCERLASLVLEIARDVAVKRRIDWVQEELRKDRRRGSGR